MADVISVKGISVTVKEGEWIDFAVRDSTQTWFSSPEGLKIISPKLFEHIKKRRGSFPKQFRIKLELRILDDY